LIDTNQNVLLKDLSEALQFASDELEPEFKKCMEGATDWLALKTTQMAILQVKDAVDKVIKKHGP